MSVFSGDWGAAVRSGRLVPTAGIAETAGRPEPGPGCGRAVPTGAAPRGETGAGPLSKWHTDRLTAPDEMQTPLSKD